MREEAEEVVSRDGWSKVAIQKMRRVDSFLKEAQRMFGLGDSKYIPLNIFTSSFLICLRFTTYQSP